jgi:hypothetical protein
MAMDAIPMLDQDAALVGRWRAPILQERQVLLP